MLSVKYINMYKLKDVLNIQDAKYLDKSHTWIIIFNAKYLIVIYFMKLCVIKHFNES